MDARTQRRLEELAERRGAVGFTFDDLAAAAVETGAGAREVAEWLTQGRESGYLADLGAEALSDGTLIGPQRFCLAAALDRRPAGSGHACDESNGGPSRAPQRYSSPCRW